jgi:hypothetical protein
MLAIICCAFIFFSQFFIFLFYKAQTCTNTHTHVCYSNNFDLRKTFRRGTIAQVGELLCAEETASYSTVSQVSIQRGSSQFIGRECAAWWRLSHSSLVTYRWIWIIGGMMISVGKPKKFYEKPAPVPLDLPWSHPRLNPSLLGDMPIPETSKL